MNQIRLNKFTVSTLVIYIQRFPENKQYEKKINKTLLQVNVKKFSK